MLIISEFNLKISRIRDMKQNINVRLLLLTANNSSVISRLLYIFGFIFLIPRIGKRGERPLMCFMQNYTEKKMKAIVLRVSHWEYYNTFSSVSFLD